MALTALVAASCSSGSATGTGTATTIESGTPATVAATPDATDATPTPSSAPSAPASTAASTTVDPIDLPQPGSSAELAAALSEAELAVRRTELSADERAAWGQRQQRLYRGLGTTGEWVEEVQATVDPSIRSAVVGNWQARLELDALLAQHKLSDTLPAWRIEAPLPADELLGYYREAGERHGVPWEILAAINLIETRMGRINGISTAGAQGPMQFLPSTWAECCDGDPTNDRDAINGAAKYLIDRGGANDLQRAIFGYNNSDHYVAAVTAYAAVMAEDPDAYYGYHGWQVYFLSTAGLALLPEGYEELESVDAATWLAADPDRRVDLG